VTIIATLLGRAVAAHRAGRIGEAMAAYREVLAVEPGHARANHLLGFALLQIGLPADALPLLAAALQRSPRTPDAWAHFGIALSALGQPVHANTALRRALLLSPALIEAEIGMIQAARDSGRAVPERTAARVVVLAPMRAVGWHGLGLARAGRGFGTGPADDGASCLRRAALIDPADRPAVTDLADVLRSRRDPESARTVGRWAVRLTPSSSAAHSILAATLFDLDRIEEADDAARTAAALAPGNAKAYGNRAQCLYRADRFAEAAREGRRATTLDPKDPQIRANLASYRLALGDLADGWRLFRDRPSRRILARRPGLPPASWAGETGARVMVLAEQGLGDELLFATCWPDLADRVREGDLAAVAVELDARLRPLAERSYPELHWFDRDRSDQTLGTRPECPGFEPTHWIAAGDLPSVFRRRIDEFPAGPSHLAPDPARVAEFRRWLDTEAPGVARIGLCWRSGLRTGDRLKHYPMLSDCHVLLRRPDWRMVVLQYDDCADEIAEATAAGAPQPLIAPDLDRRDDLDGVAALIAALDLVVSAETAVLSLAGATGAPTVGFGLGRGWVALGQGRSPWYPTVAGLHRRPGEDWPPLMARVADRAARSIADGAVAAENTIAHTKEPGSKAARLD